MRSCVAALPREAHGGFNVVLVFLARQQVFKPGLGGRATRAEPPRTYRRFSGV